MCYLRDSGIVNLILFVRSCRLIIRNAVNASEHDSVIFCGSGTTGAVERLIHILNHPKNLVGPLFTGCYIRVSVNFRSYSFTCMQWKIELLE